MKTSLSLMALAFSLSFALASAFLGEAKAQQIPAPQAWSGSLPCGVVMSSARTVRFKLFGKVREFVEMETRDCDAEQRPFYAIEYQTYQATAASAKGYRLRISTLDEDVVADARAQNLTKPLKKADRQYFAKTIVPLMDAGAHAQARTLWINRLLSR